MLLEFPLAPPKFDTLCVLVGQIVGFASAKDGSVSLFTTSGQTFALSETYDEVRAKIRNATAPRPY